MRISDWSSDVCSSDLTLTGFRMISLQDAQDSAQSLREALDGAGLSDAVEIRKTVDENGMVRFAIDLAPGRKDRMEAILRHLGDEIGRASCRERVCQYV